MLLTKLGHSCVRLEKDGGALIIDPGIWSGGADTLAGASAVLITHDHTDHLDNDAVVTGMRTNPELEIWTNPSVAAQFAEFGGRVRAVGHGDQFQAANFDIRVYGELHALIHPDMPTIPNIGFAVDGEIFHPGDSFTIPAEPVGTLLLPVTAPWLKVSEVIDYARAIGPARAIAIHDELGNDKLLNLIQRLITAMALPGDGQYARLEPGTGVTI